MGTMKSSRGDLVNDFSHSDSISDMGLGTRLGALKVGLLWLLIVLLIPYLLVFHSQIRNK